MRRLLPLLLVAGFAARLPAADPPKKKGTSYAFLVGCAGYNKAELKPIAGEETVNDVIEFRKALLATGFKDENVVLMHDRRTDSQGRYLPEHAKIVGELDLLLDGLTAADTVVVALSGHGIHFKGDKFGYFCPLDAKVSSKERLLPLDGTGGLYTLLEKCKAGRKLLIANACRNDPASAASLAGGRVEVVDEYPETAPKGVAAIYSCDVGQKSYFDPDRKRSLFFLHFHEAWVAGGNLEEVFESARTKTKSDASRTFREKQFPVVKRQYEGEWLIPGPIRWPGEDDYRKAQRDEQDWPIYVSLSHDEHQEWYRKAVEAGHPLAKIERAAYLRKSPGSAESVREAGALERAALPDIRDAAERNSAAAQFYLGLMYLQGLGGLPKDEVGALKRIHTAAEGDNTQAQLWLAKSYASGEGVEKNPAEALKWLERAATQGNTLAQLWMSDVYLGENRFGGDAKLVVKSDAKVGLKWFVKAAEQGNPTAQLFLGWLYLDERGEKVVEKDIDEAVKWLRKAADQGSEMAKETLEKIGKSPQ